MYCIVKLAVCLLAATLICSAAMADSVSLTQGVNSYTGTTMGEMAAGAWGQWGYTTSTYLMGPGGQYFGLQRMWSPGYKIRSLLRWNLQGVVPAGDVVTSAQLVLVRDSQADDSNGADPTMTVNIQQALQPWQEPSSGNGVTWMNWSNGGRLMDPNNTPYGVLQDPNPAYVGEVMGAFSSIGSAGDVQYTVNLDASVVNGWINNPSSNDGMFIKYAVDDTVNSTQSWWRGENYATASDRPTLILTYAPVPEPSALLTLAGFLAGSGMLVLRRRK